MSNWITITVADLNDGKVAALVDALRTAALADGQTDPSPRVIQDVVDHIRRKIAGNTANRVDADPTTVPRSLKNMAVDLVVHALKNRLEEELTAYEIKQAEYYQVELNRIADGKDTIEQADAPIPAPVQHGNAFQTVQDGNSGNDRQSLRGL